MERSIDSSVSSLRSKVSLGDLSDAMKQRYERHLSHQFPEGVPIFVTWNLKGAFPYELVNLLNCERKRLEQQPSRPDETPRDRAIRIDKLIFAMADRYLDSANSGSMDLKDAVAAKIVEDSILFGTPERYELFAWCVMGNHVHVLLKPKCDFAKITQGIKGFTAHEINGYQSECGRTFWQDESYDHWSRGDDELFAIISYIENNPVAAGLCSIPSDWQWSSSRHRANWPIGEPYRRSAFPD